jgi:hypothetical protein
MRSQILSTISITLAALCALAATADAQVLSVTFDGQTPGAQPTGAIAVRPNTNTVDLFTAIVTGTGNVAGGGIGEGVRLFDNSGSGGGLDYNFVADTNAGNPSDQLAVLNTQPHRIS